MQRLCSPRKQLLYKIIFEGIFNVYIHVWKKFQIFNSHEPQWKRELFFSSSPTGLHHMTQHSIWLIPWILTWIKFVISQFSKFVLIYFLIETQKSSCLFKLTISLNLMQICYSISQTKSAHIDKQIMNEKYSEQSYVR